MTKRKRNSAVAIHRWLAEPLGKPVAQSIERLAACEDVAHIAVMTDVHLSGDVCVGLAVATRQLIYPAAVGGDIGCGMAAIALDAAAELLAHSSAAEKLLTGLKNVVPPMRHPASSMLPELPQPLRSTPLSEPRLEKLTSRDGRVQFATLGRGNHFLELQADREKRLWVMLHSGSRAMGQAITGWHVAQAELQSARRKLSWLNSQSPAGQAYLADVQWAVRYAEQSRLAMLQAVGHLMIDLFSVQLDWNTLIHCNHNHVQREMHEGRQLFVHRKGALPAGVGIAGVIPGSMGTPSYHVTGRGCPEALHSSSHGAGRDLSRGEAAQRISARQLLQEMRGVWFDDRHADALCDEAPSAYRDVRSVMRAQRTLTRIDRQLWPLLSYKGV